MVFDCDDCTLPEILSQDGNLEGIQLEGGNVVVNDVRYPSPISQLPPPFVFGLLSLGSRINGWECWISIVEKVSIDVCILGRCVQYSNPNIMINTCNIQGVVALPAVFPFAPAYP